MDLSDEARAQFQIPPDVDNPMVVEIERDSKAANAGIRVGDIIVDVNKTEVTKAADAVKLLRAGKNIIRIARGDTILIVTINTK
jgi:C-terminal processing protease CtpA/Prc